MRHLKLTCTKCKNPMEVDVGFEGMTLRCDKCGHFMRIPGEAEEEDDIGAAAIFGRPDSPVSDEALEDGLIVAKSVDDGANGPLVFCPKCRRRLARSSRGGPQNMTCPSCGRFFRLTAQNTPVEEEAPTDDDGDDVIEATIDDSSALNIGERELYVPPTKRVVNSIGMEFLFFPPSAFKMGTPPNEEGRDDDEHQHFVRLTHGFHMSVTPVTQTQYELVMGSNPSSFKGENLPVDRVSWNEAVEFCKKLGELRPKLWQRLKNKGEAGRTYRLPTEAEWEYGCRAGVPWAFSTGRRITTDQANFDGRHTYSGAPGGKFRGRTSPVNRFPANPFGLHDMHGNVAEWCGDFYATYSRSSVIDPVGPDKGLTRVIRGGSWHTPAKDCRSGARNHYTPDVRYNDAGFRVVMENTE